MAKYACDSRATSLSVASNLLMSLFLYFYTTRQLTDKNIAANVKHVEDISRTVISIPSYFRLLCRSKLVLAVMISVKCFCFQFNPLLSNPIEIQSSKVYFCR